jgi:hypothetical protein
LLRWWKEVLPVGVSSNFQQAVGVSCCCLTPKGKQAWKFQEISKIEKRKITKELKKIKPKKLDN